MYDSIYSCAPHFTTLGSLAILEACHEFTLLCHSPPSSDRFLGSGCHSRSISLNLSLISVSLLHRWSSSLPLSSLLTSKLSHSHWRIIAKGRFQKKKCSLDLICVDKLLSMAINIWPFIVFCFVRPFLSKFLLWVCLSFLVFVCSFHSQLIFLHSLLFGVDAFKVLFEHCWASSIPFVAFSLACLAEGSLQLQ